MIDANFPVALTYSGTPGCTLHTPGLSQGIDSLGDGTGTPATIDHCPHWAKENPKRLIFGLNITLPKSLGHHGAVSAMGNRETEKPSNVGDPGRSQSNYNATLVIVLLERGAPSVDNYRA
ncbi:hypothetical protein I7I51_01990 [Histoplasma capsulatum]|uniref:Uncharacterized protein n=1 Tax=Ajellomyces capsulatus TaxID=5037 RepID=A0A8A1MG91_AJECA|nr:predicted protein [Histoplasma mississippiense (nom. inval.)]EDN10531.1 predicted protein [Histoplasma mississippiense (nom. inval.)]QSS64915.1 hypothetical protein I7I51_01990 [Histoplasma capsulatum]